MSGEGVLTQVQSATDGVSDSNISTESSLSKKTTRRNTRLLIRWSTAAE